MGAITRVERLKEEDGTYEVTLKEVERRKLTTKDELLPIIMGLARDAQEAWQFEKNLKHIGRNDPFVVFAHSFIKYLEEDPYLFDDFLTEVKSRPRTQTK